MELKQTKTIRFDAIGPFQTIASGVDGKTKPKPKN
jgi:hypothetical protein